MRHEITVFASLLKLIPRSTFDALVKKHRMDVGVRGLTTRAQFSAMLFARLSGAASLRDLVTMTIFSGLMSGEVRVRAFALSRAYIFFHAIA